MPNKRRRRRLRRNPDFDHEFDWQEFFRPSKPRTPLPYAKLGLWVASDLTADLPETCELLADGLTGLVNRNLLQESTGPHMDLVSEAHALRADHAEAVAQDQEGDLNEIENLMVFAIAAMVEALDQYAPPFAYFGALGRHREGGELVAGWSHALGFWPDWPKILVAINNEEWHGPPLVGASSDSDVGPGFNGYVLWFVRLGVHHSALYRWHDRQGDDDYIDRRIYWDTVDLYDSPGILPLDYEEE